MCLSGSRGGFGSACRCAALARQGRSDVSRTLSVGYVVEEYEICLGLRGMSPIRGVYIPLVYAQHLSYL